MNAYGYDLILCQLASLALLLVFLPLPSLEQIVLQAPEGTAWFSAFTNVYLVLSAFYNILMIAGPRQATLGKRYCGIKVVMADGSKPTLLQSGLRHALSGISSVTLLGFAIVLFTKEKTAIHDIIARTRVVHKEAA
jgi:uncharacterized RDD family membrane protein YckC